MERKSENPNLDEKLRLLDVFAGKWNTSGILKAAPDQPAIHFYGTDTYEWLPGRFYLLHSVDVMMGEERKQSIEIIGYDPLSETYPMRYFDDKGESGIMHGIFEGDKWTILSTEMRFSGGFEKDKRKITGNWQHRVGNEWQHLMEITLEKA